MITILTPSYNRAHLLPQLYDSLCRQTSHGFEWIIVDDGSSDNTNEVVKGQISRAPVAITYIYKENGGKHTALNLGVAKAAGELTLILDSDDELPPTAIADISAEWEKAKQHPTHGKPLGGICGYMAHRNGEIIGKPKIETVCDELQMRYRHNVTGDMCEVFRTEVLREFPFPEIAGERFCPEALVWNRIAQKYSLYITPKVVYLRDYLDGGLTDNIVRIRMQSPVASMMTYAEMAGFAGVPLKARLRAAINYWRFRACLGEGSAAPLPHLPLRWMWTRPIGMLMHLRDKKAIR